MLLRSLTADNFRNLAGDPFEFHETTNIVVGRNGQGKTNLLEAIYFLATTKSFRTNRAASLFRFGATNLFVTGDVQRQELQRSVSVGLETGEVKRRVLMVNGERVALSAYVNTIIVFAYSSARLEIIRGMPEERRKFLDRGLAGISAGYLEQLTRYTRVLKQRNALLYEIGTGGANVRSLDVWDEAFLTAAGAVQNARAAYTTELFAAFRDIIERHRYHVSDVDSQYKPSRGDLRALRREEVRARTSLTGPQRDVLEILIEGRPAAEVLSGGELKTLVLFLKFAKLALYQRRFEERPLFLLDDIDAELDLEILQELVAKLPASTQVFATSAKEAFLQALQAGPHRRLTVENGAVTATRDFA
jgi:DNA replication and repair protein RecF